MPPLSVLPRLAAAWACLAAPISAMEPIRYTLRFPAPQTHAFDVEAIYPVSGGAAAADLFMAVWTPGSYLVREYAGKLDRLRAFDESGRELAIRKTAKNRWRVETGGAPRVRVGYRVYAREMSVRTNWVERDFAILVGAATFVALLDPATGRPAATEHHVRLERPDGWRPSRSGMTAGPEPDTWIAADFDELVDSPILAGADLNVYPFEVDGVPHELVNLGEDRVWDGPRAAADVERIARAQAAFWGGLPYPRYSVLNAIVEAGGGLEHKTSTLLMARRFATRTRKDYVRWLALVSHEHFHAWNGKRLRPIELGPFDYESENYTTALWAVEGLTSYYESLLLARAGLIDSKEFLEHISADIESLQTTPGRNVESATEASYDAWIKLYRRDEGSPNRTISYYVKGAVVGLLLDARIRAATGDATSLDDLMREAYRRFSGDRGYRDEDLRALVGEMAGAETKQWLDEALDDTAELDYAPLLERFGLRFAPPKNEPDDEPPAWLGAQTAVRDGRLVVTGVRADGPAYEAGLGVDDEILAIDGFRVPPAALDDRLGRYRPGDRLALLVARREKLTPLTVVAGVKPAEIWKLEIDPEAPADAVRRREAWLQAAPAP